MTSPLIAYLLRLSEHGPATLSGDVAKTFFGPAFERLLSDRILEEIEPAATWTPCLNCDCLADGRIIERLEGRIVATCLDDVERDVGLDTDDIRRFDVDEERLVSACLGVGPPPRRAP